MKPLSQNNFNNWIKGLKITVDSDQVQISDDNKIIYTLSRSGDVDECEDHFFIDEDEHSITELQIESLYLLAKESFSEQDDYDVREHGIYGFGY